MRGMGMMRGRRMGGMGMMGGGGMCPMCGRSTDGGEEEGPHAGKGPRAPRQRGDDEIRADAEQALTDDSWLDASAVDVQIEAGVATLDGDVESRAAKRRAEDLVDEIPGVNDVRNNLRISDQPQSSS